MANRRIENAGQAVVVSGCGPRGVAFSLLELLVVVGIIVVLISTLLPSLRQSIRQANAAVCMNNLRQIGHGIDLYRMDNNGWGPVTTGSDDERDMGPPVSVWFQKLVNGGLKDSDILVCPDDPLRPWLLRNDSLGAHAAGPVTSSYGMNQFILDSPDQFLGNLDRIRPKRPLDTLLVADMGPDTVFVGSSSGPTVEGPKRNNGTLPWDDGYRPGDPDEQLPWLTTRHLGGINVLMIGGNVHRVATRSLMGMRIQPRYLECAAGDCTLCRVDVALDHYTFAASRTYWWTGPVPTR